jgi:voltage-gated potassium channel Kch
LLFNKGYKNGIEDSEKIQLHMLFVYIFIVNIIFATSIYYFLYGQISNAVTYFDHVYFATVSLTTIGYGDMAPTTQKARMWVSLYLFILYILLLSL